jgi:hypothetical protein
MAASWPVRRALMTFWAREMSGKIDRAIVSINNFTDGITNGWLVG